MEAIFNLTRQSDVARSKDIAAKIGGRPAFCYGRIAHSGKTGLVNYQPYGFVSLTKAGQARAAAVAKKHDIIKSFFVDVLGVEAESAAEAACKAEHSIGKHISGKLTAFVEYITHGSEMAKIWFLIFTNFTIARIMQYVNGSIIVNGFRRYNFKTEQQVFRDGRAE